MVNGNSTQNTSYNDGSNSDGSQTFVLSFTSKASKDLLLTDTIAVSWLLNIQTSTNRVHHFHNNADDYYSQTGNANGDVDEDGVKVTGGGAVKVIQE